MSPDSAGLSKSGATLETEKATSDNMQAPLIFSDAQGPESHVSEMNICESAVTVQNSQVACGTTPEAPTALHIPCEALPCQNGKGKKVPEIPGEEYKPCVAPRRNNKRRKMVTPAMSVRVKRQPTTFLSRPR